MLKRLVGRYRDSGIYAILNWKEEKAIGRSSMLLAGVLGALYTNMASGVFFTCFLLASGLDVTQIGLLCAIPFLTSIFAIFSPLVLAPFRKRKKVLAITRLIFHLLNFVGIALVPLLRDSQRFMTFAIVLALANAVNMLFGTGFSAWHYNFLPEDMRASFFTIQQIVNGGLASITLIGFGFLSDIVQKFDNAQIFFALLRVLAFIIAVVETVVYCLPHEYEYPPETNAGSPLALFRAAMKYKKFMATMGIVFLWNLGAYIPASALDVHLLQKLNVPPSLITGCSASFFLMLVLFSPLWNKLLAKLSWFKTLGLAVLLHAPFSASIGFVTADNYLWLYPLSRFIQLFLCVGITITIANMPFINLPPQDQTTCMSLHILVTNVAAFSGQLIGTAIIQGTQKFSFILFEAEYNIVSVLMVIQGLFFIVLGIFAWTGKKYLSPT